jgi:hypothetical protein
LSGLPPAGLGALLTLFLFHRDLDIYGFLLFPVMISIITGPGKTRRTGYLHNSQLIPESL